MGWLKVVAPDLHNENTGTRRGHGRHDRGTVRKAESSCGAVSLNVHGCVSRASEIAGSSLSAGAPDDRHEQTIPFLHQHRKHVRRVGLVHAANAVVHSGLTLTKRCFGVHDKGPSYG